MYKNIQHSKFGKHDGEDQKTIFPNVVSIKVTSSTDAHKNVSPLNVARRGEIYLLSCQPPVWQRQLKPPIFMRSWFDYGIPNYAVQDNIRYIREFLLRFESLELSIKKPERMAWLRKMTNLIIDDIFYHAGLIQALPAGWSDTPDIRLKAEHQYFLDPYRSDETFQAKRDGTDWEKTICHDFALWLNRKLQGKDKKFTPQKEHERFWQTMMEEPLRDLGDIIKSTLKSAEVTA